MVCFVCFLLHLRRLHTQRPAWAHSRWSAGAFCIDGLEGPPRAVLGKSYKLGSFKQQKYILSEF